jgi:CHASE2 domain-containing sensor protein
VDALLAFAAALVTLRLSGELVRRFRARRRPELAAWAAGLAAYSLAAGALAWGAAAGWSDAAFRVYYLGGALLTAALLGVGSLLLVGRRWVAPVALLYVGLAVGVAVAVPLHGELTGSEIPEAQDVLDVWPARALAIVGNSVGTVAVVVIALATLRSRPVGNVLILAGIGVAGIGSGLAGLGIGALAPAIAIAAVLLYAGFVAPAALPQPDPHQQREHRERDRALHDGAGQAPMGH